MLPRKLLDEIKDNFQDYVLVTRLIDHFFEKESPDLKIVLDEYVGEKLDEIDKH